MVRPGMVGSIGNKFIAIVNYDGTNVTSQVTFEGGFGAQLFWVFRPTPGDTTGTQIDIGTMNSSLHVGTFTTGTVIAADADHALIQFNPPGGGTIFYLISGTPFSNIPPAGQYPITDLGTTGTSFTPPPVGAVCFVEGTASAPAAAKSRSSTCPRVTRYSWRTPEATIRKAKRPGR